MLTERPIHTDIRKMVLQNEPLQVAHLIKFERPSRPDSNSGQVSTAKQRYTYICDASRDVKFDDGSSDNSGARNGVQTYRANKVLKVSTVSEDTEAKASSYSLVLDGSGLGAYAQSAATIVSTSTYIDVTLTQINLDLVSEGFREGDKVKFSGLINGYFNIHKFRGPNIIRVTPVDQYTVSDKATDLLTLELASEEIVSVLQDKNAENYASFINREVFIYRGYFSNGKDVGTPFLLFKGIISGVNFDDGDNELTVTWNLTSHWGDFSQVKGRITSDDFHRALDQNGIPQPQSALKVAYAYDKGFAHAETSISILAQYSVQVEKQDVKVKKGFLGIGSKVKVKKYYETESRNTQLDFQLQAKSIPVIYGVRNTEGIPVFADTLNNDSSTVYTIEALSEGEIGGIYDVYVDGNSLICNDKADFDARSKQTLDDTVQLICRGRADRGDVLGGVASTVPIKNDFYDYYSYEPGTPYKFSLNYDLPYLNNFPTYVEPTVTVADTTGAGIVDGQSISLTSPQQITLDVFSGKPGQKAAASLVAIAKANNFKIQNAYWSGKDTADYWSPNHRLLDTAYVVGKYKVEEGETTIPSTEYIVRGKVLECYNYDYSYSHNNKVTGESADNFQLGDVVDLRSSEGTINAGVQIIDKWTFRNADGTANTRFRFSATPSLRYVNGVPTVTSFQMIKGNASWSMVTFNHREFEGTVATESISAVTAATNNGNSVQFGFNSNAGFTQGGDPAENSSAFAITDANGYPTNNAYFGYSVLIGDVTATTLKTKYSWAAAGPAATAAVGRSIVRRNVVILPTGANTTNNYYVGSKVTLTRLETNTGKITTQTKSVIAYDGSTRTATIDGLWDYGYHPKVGDKVYLSPAYADSRVSINTPMQLMDYICSKTYGRGLDPQQDLNFPSWLEAARAADEQSNVTVKAVNSDIVPVPGTKYRYPQSGTLLWQGTVVGSDNGYTEFTDVIGKLTNKWNNWKSYKLNELVYSDSGLYLVTSPGVKLSQPTHGSGELNGLRKLDSLKLTKNGVDDTQTNLSLTTDGNPVRSFKNGQTIPGYSLYDCDGVDYWRLLGWDEFNQRYVTRHQTNLIVDTSLPLLDNVNSFLEHMGGILRYSGGQYYLELEQPEGVIEESDNEVRYVTQDHIIGKIRLTDEGIRSAFNSLTASYADPANKYDSRNISFFNSDYLKADRNVPKKGSLSVPGITNYYNTRLLADRTLNKSRFGLTASFNMAPRGVLLLSGKVIAITHKPYGWESKKFRITNLTHQPDATVDIVCEEYDDSFYGLSKISKQAAAGLAGNTGSVTGIGAPSGLTVTNVDSGDETNSAIALTWINNEAANSKNVFTEIYSSYSPYLYIETATVSGNTITTSESPHQLKVGEQIIALAGVAGLSQGRTYFIAAIPAPNQFQLSETKGGGLVPLTDGDFRGYHMQTASLTATVPVPTTAYVDVFGGIDNRVVKYYWIRHKVVQVT